MCLATHYTFRSSSAGGATRYLNWRRKFAKTQKSTAELCQILRMVTVEIDINSTRVMGMCDNILPVCIVLDGTMLLFLVTGRIAA